MTDPWPLDHRRDALRSCIYLMICDGNDISHINETRLLETYHPDIKPGTLRKWWAEERVKYDREQAEKLARVPPDISAFEEGGK